MNNTENKIIIVLLFAVIILSVILIIKIKSSEYKPNQELYSQIYSEYIDEYNPQSNKQVTVNSTDYKKEKTLTDQKNVIGKLEIPKINISYPIIYKTTEEFLKIAPTKLCGGNVNEVGNFCIIAHNYKYNNEEFFYNLKELEIGDNMFLTTNTGRKAKMYRVYKKYEVSENDLSCLDQDTGGKIETTLITCTDKKDKRLVVKCVSSS